MGFADLLAQNVLLRWLTGRGASHELAVTMSGVRLGERLLQIGLGDGGLLVALARKVGMSGRVCGLDEDAAAVARAERAAAKAGVLVELEQAALDALPFDTGSFDVVVFGPVRTDVAPAERPFAEAARVLRPGGRCLVILRSRRGGSPRSATASVDDAGPAPSAVVNRLQQSGFRAARVLAEREGMAFAEAAKESHAGPDHRR